MRGWPPPRGRSTGASRRIRRSAPAPAYAAAAELQADLDTIARLADGQRLGARWRAAACATLRRAVDVFGFHLAPARPAPELRRARARRRRAAARRPASAPTTRRWTRPRAPTLLRRELGNAAAAALAASSTTASETRRRARDLRGRGGCAAPLRRRSRSALHHLQDRQRLATCWRWRCCSRRSGLLRPREAPARRRHRRRCSRPSTTCALRPRSWTSSSALPAYRRAARARAAACRR